MLGKRKNVKRKPVRKQSGVTRPEPDPEEEIELSVHRFDCTLDPPRRTYRLRGKPKRKDVVRFDLVIRKKGWGDFNDITAKYGTEFDVIFLTKRARGLWDKYVPDDATWP